ncbi:MAG: hypothetical protein AAF587_14420 [Bacteroidota bacterium]
MNDKVVPKLDPKDQISLNETFLGAFVRKSKFTTKNSQVLAKNVANYLKKQAVVNPEKTFPRLEKNYGIQKLYSAIEQTRTCFEDIAKQDIKVLHKELGYKSPEKLLRAIENQKSNFALSLVNPSFSAKFLRDLFLLKHTSDTKKVKKGGGSSKIVIRPREKANKNDESVQDQQKTIRLKKALGGNKANLQMDKEEIASYISAYNTLQRQYNELEKDLGTAHSSLTTAQKQIEELENQVTQTDENHSQTIGIQAEEIKNLQQEISAQKMAQARLMTELKEIFEAEADSFEEILGWIHQKVHALQEADQYLKKQNQIDQWKLDIGDGKVKKVLQEIMIFCKDHSKDQEKECIQLLQWFSNIQRKQNTGTLSEAEYRQELNRISGSTVDLMNEISKG